MMFGIVREWRPRKAFGATIALWMIFIAGIAAGRSPKAANPSGDGFNYRVGCGRADITGPAVGVQMFGFVRADQITEGIHIRLHSRAYVIAAPEGDARIAFVVADLGSITHEMQREVVERLRETHGDLYRLDNVVLSATHTHSGPGGFWHYGADTPVGTPFLKQHFDAIVEGMVESVNLAHGKLAPARIEISGGDVEGGGANRSLAAYMNNPEEERSLYPDNIDRTMTLLKFIGKDGPIGMLNWYAVHPTSMTYNNHLISGDHKGYASQTFENDHSGGDPGFIAAFAQTNCGDVTPNLNLNNTGPGENEFETTRIIGDRQLECAARLFAGTGEALEGGIDTRQSYIDFSSLEVEAGYTGGRGTQHTCVAAYGYSFAAGSGEDGGGLAMFREGMLKRLPMIDSLVTQFAPIPPPTDALRACHAPKPVLFSPGESDPPSMPNIIPISLLRVGQLVLIAGPGEFTTMAGRRIRAAVADILGRGNQHYVIAGYSNGFTGYITTFEEYQLQHYEGGHTVFGPWTQAGYQQEYVRLAEAMKGGEAVVPPAVPEDIRARVKSTLLEAPPESFPDGTDLSVMITDADESYSAGDTVLVTCRSGNPRHDYSRNMKFVSVERRENGAWKTVATDDDWSTKIRWYDPDKAPETEQKKYVPLAPIEPLRVSQAEITWTIPAGTAAGAYRIVHHGLIRTTPEAEARRITVTGREFEIK